MKGLWQQMALARPATKEQAPDLVWDSARPLTKEQEQALARPPTEEQEQALDLAWDLPGPLTKEQEKASAGPPNKEQEQASAGPPTEMLMVELVEVACSLEGKKDILGVKTCATEAQNKDQNDGKVVVLDLLLREAEKSEGRAAEGGRKGGAAEARVKLSEVVGLKMGVAVPSLLCRCCSCSWVSQCPSGPWFSVGSPTNTFSRP